MAFKKRHNPWNKNTKGIMKPNQTSFKKGQEPWNKNLHGDPRMVQASKKGWEALRDMGFPNRVGKKHSEETKKKISANRKGKSFGSERWNWAGGKPRCIDCGKLLSRRGYEQCVKCYLKSDKAKKRLQEIAKLGLKKRWEGHVRINPIQKKNLNPKPRIKRTIIELLERKRFRNQRYKANKRNALGSHTFEEWETLKQFYNYMCLCCKRFEPEIKLTEDHIIPLSMKGTDYIWNIQPLCQNCNTRKHAKYINYRNIFNKGGEKRQFIVN